MELSSPGNGETEAFIRDSERAAAEIPCRDTYWDTLSQGAMEIADA